MFKKILITIVTVFLVVVVVLLLTGRTVIIPVSKYKAKTNSALNKGDIVKPLETFDFSKGDWKAYVVFNSTDIKELPQNFAHNNCFKSTDRELLKRMQNGWEFEYQGGDMATVQSKLLLFKNGDLVYRTGIVVSNEVEGLQSGEAGWLDGTNEKKISKYLIDFKKVYLPIIFL